MRTWTTQGQGCGHQEKIQAAHNVAGWDESDVDNTEKLAGDIQTFNGGIKVSRSVWCSSHAAG